MMKNLVWRIKLYYHVCLLKYHMHVVNKAWQHDGIRVMNSLDMAEYHQNKFNGLLLATLGEA